MKFIVNYFLLFMFFAFLGWIGESLYVSIGKARKTHEFHFVNRGFLSGPIVPLYGVGAVLATLTLAPFHGRHVIVFFLGILVFDTLEYFTSWSMEKLFHARWWDYTGKFLNIKGRICGLNSLIWGAASVIFIQFIEPGTMAMILRTPWNFKLALFWILLAIFLFDLYRTVSASINIHTLQTKARKLRDQILAFNPNEQIRSSVFVKSAHEIRETITRQSTWSAARMRRMLRDYPFFLKGFPEEHPEDTEDSSKAELLRSLTDSSSEVRQEMEFLQMDVKTFFTHDKYEMY